MEQKIERGDRRYTVRTLAAGQPRAYADTIRHVRVTFEIVPYTGELEWKPHTMREEYVRKALLGLQCGFTEFTYPPKDREATPGDYFADRLNWLREKEPGVWEFYTTSAYTG